MFTNGCFDLLHIGHVRLLEEAKRLGDWLVVGVNGDESVQKLKGPERPINAELERAAVVAALESVDRVFVFHQPRVTQILYTLHPDVWVKGGTYTLDTLCQDEVHAAQAVRAEIKLLPVIPGKSTTNVIDRLKASPG